MSSLFQHHLTTLRGIALTLAAFLALVTPAVLHASPVTYNLTLTPTSGIYGGTGSITVENAVPSTGQYDYTVAAGTLDALSFSIDGQTFSLDGDTGALVRFLNGQINNITFAETIGSGYSSMTLDTTGNYAFYYYSGHTAMESSGTLSSSLAPAIAPAVPEPGSLVLLGTGLFAGAASAFRRFSAKRPS